MSTEEKITLRAGLEQFYKENEEYFGHHDLAMSDKAKAFLEAHDAAHVLFDCDISLFGEGSVKIWTIFGTTLGFWKHISEYKEAQAFELARTFSFWHVVNNTFKFLFTIPKLIYRAKRMNKPWPWLGFESYLDTPINEIRKEYNITV
ncbi:hypothetical protein [uncultured Croceitalea sp.]|uniref:hypothetical protein n=1 Tax=uncultured Croceitalea sp. TaxID=1798908 RepID=UPI003305F690